MINYRITFEVIKDGFWLSIWRRMCKACGHDKIRSRYVVFRVKGSEESCIGAIAEAVTQARERGYVIVKLSAVSSG